MIGVRVFEAKNRNGFHIDEMCSYQFISGGDEPLMFLDKDLLNKWHDKNFFLNYITVNDDAKYNLSKISEKTGQDVHPPLYYWVLQLFVIAIDNGEMNFWGGFILNILLFIVSSALFFFVARFFIKDTFLTYAAFLMWGFSVAAISNSLFIRMYEMLTFFVLATILSGFYFLKTTKVKFWHHLALTLSFVGGLLTHYFYLFLLVPFSFFLILKLILARQHRRVMGLFIALAISIGVSLYIFPQAMKHLLLSSRSNDMKTGMMESLTSTDVTSLILERFREMSTIFNEQVFYFSLNLFVIACVVSLIIFLKKEKGGLKNLSSLKKIISNRSFLLIIFVNWLAIVTLSAPYVIMRYIIAILPIFFIIIVVFLEYIFTNNKLKRTLATLFLIFVFSNIFLLDTLPHTNFENSKASNLEPNKAIVLVFPIEKKYTLGAMMPYFISQDRTYFSTEDNSQEILLENDFRYLFLEKSINLESLDYENQGNLKWLFSSDYYNIYLNQ